MARNLPICVLDACSYLYQKATTLNQSTTLFDYVKKNLPICFSHTVNQEITHHLGEFQNYFTETTDAILKRHNYCEALPIFHSDLFPSASSGRNEGEKENFSLSLQKSKTGKFSVFVSDNLKAIGNRYKGTTGHLAQYKASFPFFNIWTSLDLVLFLYFQNVIPKYIALDAIYGINSFIQNTTYKALEREHTKGNIDTQNFEEKKAQLTNFGQKRAMEYRQAIEDIQKTFKN